MTQAKVFLNHLGLINALGHDKRTIFERLVKGDTTFMQFYQSRYFDKTFMVGRVNEKLPKIPEHLSEYDCRNNQLLIAASEQILAEVERFKAQYKPSRIGIVLGTSTSGIEEYEKAMAERIKTGQLPSGFHYKQQEIGTAAEFLARYLKVDGPAYTISTACSSSGKVFASARALLEQGLCDMVITGGADSLCEMTLNGFDSLEAISSELTNPFSVNRQGINIGEGAALFTMSKEVSDIALYGVGESSDAYHMSAPEPEGKGAIAAVQAALHDAGLEPQDLDYLNLHGTGTKLNDSMESRAIYKLFADQLPCSSTKALIGHTLGAAGANEAAFCWLLLSELNQQNKLAPHIFDGHYDPELAPIQLVKKGQMANRLNTTMSNSFAFGGNNVSVILGRPRLKNT